MSELNMELTSENNGERRFYKIIRPYLKIVKLFGRFPVKSVIRGQGDPEYDKHSYLDWIYALLWALILYSVYTYGVVIFLGSFHSDYDTVNTDLMVITLIEMAEIIFLHFPAAIFLLKANSLCELIVSDATKIDIYTKTPSFKDSTLKISVYTICCIVFMELFLAVGELDCPYANMTGHIINIIMYVADVYSCVPIMLFMLCTDYAVSQYRNFDLIVKQNIKSNSKSIDEITQMYYNFCNYVDKLNEIFGFYIFCFYIASFAYLMSYVFGFVLFWTNDNVIDWEEFMYHVCGIILNLIRPVVPVLLAQRLLDQSTLTKRFLKYLTPDECPGDAKEKIDILVNRMDKSDLEINAAGFFSLSKKSLSVGIGFVAIYFILLMQFHISEFTTPCKSAHNNTGT